MAIYSDSISFSRFGKEVTIFYGLSPDGAVIYFPDNKSFKEMNWNLRTPMNILELSAKKLVLLEVHGQDSTIIEYEKQLFESGEDK